MANGSAIACLIVGVEGDAVSVCVSSSVVTEGLVSEGAGGSSANTLVALGAVLSQGKMDLGRSAAGGVDGTW